MLKRFSINHRLMAVLGGMLMALLLAGCPNDPPDETPPGGDPPPSLRLRYELNASGEFVNTAPSDGNTYTAVKHGGTIAAVNEVKVFDTGGTDSGTDVTASWDSSVTWDHYENVGYVDLGAAAGDLLCTLPSFSIETYVYLPETYQIHALGSYAWTFADTADNPANAVWFSYRDASFNIKAAGADQKVEVTNGYNTIDLGSWHHIVVSKDNDTVKIYVDNQQIKYGMSTNLTTAFPAGTLKYNYLGKPAYAADEYLHNSQFHSFSIYGKALDAGEVSTLYSSGPLMTLRGLTKPGAGFTFADAATPNWTNQSVHDPSVFYDGSVYRIVGSFLASATTTNFMNWTRVQGDGNTANYSSRKYYPKDNTNTSVQTMAQQIADVQRGEDAEAGWNFFASDIHKMPNGKFYHYYSLTTSWKCSAIGVAIADTVEGNYVTQGLIVRSAAAGEDKSPDGTQTWAQDRHPNCIDPQAFFDKDGNNFYLVYGSWSGGIFLLELDPATGLRKTGSAMNAENGGYGRRLIANRHSGIEAPYILYSPGANYYYLFTSFGGLAANGGYNMRIFRSRNAYGPYEDAEHTDLVSNNLHPTAGNTYDFRKYGVKIMGGYQFGHLTGERGSSTTGYLSPGHNSAYYDAGTGKYYLIYHTRFAARGETHEVRAAELFVTENGWLIPAPFRYDAGTVRSFTADQLTGTWKIISHLRDVNTTARTSETFQFLTGGALVKAGTGAVGTWELGSDGKTARITLNDKLYKGVFLRNYDQDNSTWVQSFTAVSDDGLVIWGAGAAF
jgi:arabinan endo-1,5-alpha-L-arabinosidase